MPKLSNSQLLGNKREREDERKSIYDEFNNLTPAAK